MASVYRLESQIARETERHQAGSFCCRKRLHSVVLFGWRRCIPLHGLPGALWRRPLRWLATGRDGLNSASRDQRRSSRYSERTECKDSGPDALPMPGGCPTQCSTCDSRRSAHKHAERKPPIASNTSAGVAITKNASAVNTSVASAAGRMRRMRRE